MSIPTIEIQDPPAGEPVNHPVTKRPSEPWVRWFQTVKKQHPFFPISTGSGSVAVALPTFTNASSAAPYLNREHLYLKSTADANTVTITGGFGGNVVLSAQGQTARFRFDGQTWWPA
jgi:hypothetical protein